MKNKVNRVKEKIEWIQNLTVVRMVVEVHVKDVLEVARGSVTDNAPVHAQPPAQAHVKMVVMIGVITIVRAT